MRRTLGFLLGLSLGLCAPAGDAFAKSGALPDAAPNHVAHLITRAREGAYDGTIFRNRKRYPDGPVYACCGMPGIKHTETSRTMGTCLSNRTLLKLKQQELVEFVRRVEPGMLYIHNVDAMGIKESTEVWRLRCPACQIGRAHV